MSETPQPQSEPNTNTTSKREFARLIEPLELASGRRLGNPTRAVCLRAFQDQPDAVRKVAEEALADADDRNPVGLFGWRIANGWHELEPMPQRFRDDDPDDGRAHVRVEPEISMRWVKTTLVQLPAEEQPAEVAARIAVLQRKQGANVAAEFVRWLHERGLGELAA